VGASEGWLDRSVSAVTKYWGRLGTRREDSLERHFSRLTPKQQGGASSANRAFGPSAKTGFTHCSKWMGTWGVFAHTHTHPRDYRNTPLFRYLLLAFHCMFLTYLQLGDWDLPGVFRGKKNKTAHFHVRCRHKKHAPSRRINFLKILNGKCTLMVMLLVYLYGKYARKLASRK